MAKIKTAAAVLAVVLSGCATQEPASPEATQSGLEANLASWVGAPEIELIRQAGPPASTYTTAGTKFITYNLTRQHVVPGYGPTVGTRRIGNTTVLKSDPGRPTLVFDFRCSITYEIEAEIVRAWSFEGNDCRAVPRDAKEAKQ